MSRWVFALVTLTALAGEAQAQSGDFQFRFTPDVPPDGTQLARNCDDANLHAKYYFGVPPSCSGSSGNIHVVNLSPEGCFVQPVLGPSGEFVQNLGGAWRHWMLGTFTLHGPRCVGIRAYARAMGIGYDTGWHDLGVLRHDRMHLSFARASDPENEYVKVVAQAKEYCLPPNQRPWKFGMDKSLSLQVWVCRDGSGNPQNGCRPGTSSGGFPAAGRGIVAEAMALAAFSPPTPLPYSLGAIDPRIGCDAEKVAERNPPAGDSAAPAARPSSQAEDLFSAALGKSPEQLRAESAAAQAQVGAIATPSSGGSTSGGPDAGMQMLGAVLAGVAAGRGGNTGALGALAGVSPGAQPSPRAGADSVASAGSCDHVRQQLHKDLLGVRNNVSGAAGNCLADVMERYRPQIAQACRNSPEVLRVHDRDTLSWRQRATVACAR